MEVLKFSVNYDGYYGGNIDAHCLLPIESQGLYIEHEEGSYRYAIGLGEIEGKHSDVYGDLTIEVVNLDELPLREANTLIDTSDVGHFESFFEGAQEEIDESLDEDNHLSEEEKENIKKRKAIEEKYDLVFEDWSIKMALLSEKFVSHLKESYQKELVNFSIKKEDEKKFRQVMNDYELEIFE